MKLFFFVSIVLKYPKRVLLVDLNNKVYANQVNAIIPTKLVVLNLIRYAGADLAYQNRCDDCLI
jgi:hypothetical protein